MAERQELRPARYVTIRASAACEAENKRLREALNEAIPVLKGFCDDHFTPTPDGYAEDVRGYTPQGIATLYKLAALRDRLTPEPSEQPTGA